MSPQRSDDQHPDHPVLVSPVYLAGRGNPTAISDALYAHRDWGWTTTDTGQIFVSPRHDVHIGYLPHTRDGGWKITRYHEPLGTPAWSATFSSTTPTEIVGAFTNALAKDLAHPNAFLPHGHRHRPGTPAGILTERGWITDNTAEYLYQRSPDGHAYLSERWNHLNHDAEPEGGTPARWTMHACANAVNGESWHADFTYRTPLHLVTETVRAFSSTEPVERPRSSIPERNLPYLTTEPVPEPDSDRLRFAALARTPRAQPTGPAPSTGTAVPDPTPTAPLRRR